MAVVILDLDSAALVVNFEMFKMMEWSVQVEMSALFIFCQVVIL